MNVWKVYRSLNDEQKRTLRDKRIEMNRPVGPLLEFLKPLAACDALSDKARTRLGCSTAIAIVLTLVLLFVGIGNGWPLVIGALLLLMLAAAVICGSLWRWTRSIDVSNNFRRFAIPVLTVLREDFDPAHPIHVRLDLTAPNAPAKKRSEGAPYKKGAYYKVIDKTYVDEWMSVDGVLVDGTKLSWRIKDAIRERSKTKRNARGKIKSKTKYKKKSEIEVSVALRKKTYELQKALGAMTDDEKRRTVSLSREVVTASLDPIDPRVLLDLVASVFRNTRPAKEAGA